ncbi:hypothetical protein CY35_13G023400 [Sphagnum magellanicum]|nr:hypothetical protein CY35_13G023400 [Sphagnum magellanicum]
MKMYQCPHVLEAVELFLKLVEKTQISSVLFRCLNGLDSNCQTSTFHWLPPLVHHRITLPIHHVVEIDHLLHLSGT